MRPNKEQLQAVLDANKKIREKLPEFSMFGDANWEKIDRQNELIQRAIDSEELIFCDHVNDDDTDYEVKEWIESGDDITDYGDTALEEVE